MKFFIVVCSVLGVASAEAPGGFRGSYGVPAVQSFSSSSGGYSAPAQSGGYSGGASSGGYSGASSGGYSGGQSGGYSGGQSSGGYSAPASPSGGYSGGASAAFTGGNGGGFGGSGSGSQSGSSGGGQVRRYVSIHVAPDDPEDQQARVIRVPGNMDKHVNIIFVKAPSGSSSQNTEVILPEQPEQKTLVYVLVKKAEASSDVKIRAPQPTRPSKPEVFFIRYKNQGGGGGGEGEGAGVGGGAGSSYGAPPATGPGPY